MLLKVIIREDTTIEEPDYSNGYGLAFMFAEQSGNLILNTKNRLDNSAIVEWERSHGDSISPPKSIADTLGWVIVRDKDSHEAYNHARETACSGLFQVQR